MTELEVLESILNQSKHYPYEYAPVLSRLENKGAIVARINDNRGWDVFITPSGFALLERLRNEQARLDLESKRQKARDMVIEYLNDETTARLQDEDGWTVRFGGGIKFHFYINYAGRLVTDD